MPRAALHLDKDAVRHLEHGQVLLLGVLRQRQRRPRDGHVPGPLLLQHAEALRALRVVRDAVKGQRWRALGQAHDVEARRAAVQDELRVRGVKGLAVVGPADELCVVIFCVVSAARARACGRWQLTAADGGQGRKQRGADADEDAAARAPGQTARTPRA